MRKHTILCVDDEIDNVQALERIFRQNYQVLTATSGKQALKILDENPGKISLIITDQRMPEMTGVEFLSQSLDQHPDAVRLLLTGYTDIESVIAAINSGRIFSYLTKPWDPLDLQNTVSKAIEFFEMAEEIKRKNQELSKAYSELQTLDQAKNQFMILINHELKTPLTSILSFSELLKESHLSEEQDLYLSRIKKSADRLKNLVDDVLLVVGAETRSLRAKMNPFDLKKLDISVSNDIKNLIRQKNQILKFDFPEMKVLGDPQLLVQVFERLIHNAAKFGFEKTSIQVLAKQKAPHRVEFSIVNQGNQIPQNTIEKIMKPFFIDEDIMNHSVGMGLGLTVCQSILKAHGSRIKIENTEAGVEVSFELPFL